MSLIRCSVWLAMLAVCGCAVLGPRINRQQANDYLETGREYLAQGLSDSALAAFGMAIEVDPNLVEAHMNMGAVYRHRGNYELASRAYQRAVNLAPHHFDARYYLGWMQHLNGNLQDAVDTYLRALSINPDNFDANMNVAGAYLQFNRPDSALPYAKRATELRPDHQSAWANLATAYSLLKHYAEAIEAYLQAVELGDLAEPIMMGLANARIQLGHYKQAINVLQSINRQNPNPDTYERMGYAQFKMRQFDHALTSFRATLTLGGERTVSLNGVGVCLMAQYILDGREEPVRRDEALNIWRRSLQLYPDQPHIVDLLTRYQRL